MPALTVRCVWLQRGGDAPLHLACWKGYMRAAKKLVECGADKNVLKHVRAAAASGLLCSLVTALLPPTQDGATPLHLAASGGQVDIAEWLVGLGNDVNAKAFNGDTPMHLAAWRDRLDACKWFYAHGADPNSKKRDGATPFHVACSGGSVPVASWLLTVGADINTKANNGDMGIHLAAWVREKLRSHCCCAALCFVRDLVHACVCWTPPRRKGKRNASVSWSTGERMSTRARTVYARAVALASLDTLCLSTAPCRLQTGSTSLHLAAHQGHTATCNALIELGGDASIRNTVSFRSSRACCRWRVVLCGSPASRCQSGKTAADLARSSGHSVLARTLAGHARQGGASVRVFDVNFGEENDEEAPEEED